MSFLAELAFLLALVLLPLMDLYHVLIAIQSGMACGVKTTGQLIDNLVKYWWAMRTWVFPQTEMKK